MVDAERRPPRIDDHLETVASSLGTDGGLFVGLDFDGTLSPIASTPDEPELAAACRDALAALVAHPGVTVGVVSGRALADLKERVGVEGVVYAGNHGLELEHRGETEVHPAAATHRPHLREVRRELEGRVGDVRGCEVEDKDLTLSVHYRRTPPALVENVRDGVRDVVPEDDPDLRVNEGKAVLEVRPAIDWDKGSAILYLVEHLEGVRRIVYVGDDVTDEDAFDVLDDEDVGVHVGPGHGSAADYRVDSQDEVAPFLSWVADVVDGSS
ncbi:trehalose-phosphatase [Halorubellus sp. JP-L1]|uniref:trehalose-phosphatase n=1 Tax=Halorubellus sp. JP-L1 TaxID=2715753 RepID=UPI0014077694|nr:trehalose-phosphatase [Halorubellus sp. JP-L1]NHN42695.1 trehalose-phosphatase [Halorubellus sp. JP-L1]